MRALSRAGIALKRLGHAVTDRCKELCCGGCRRWYRYRVCATTDGPCIVDTTEWYVCTTRRCNGQSIKGRTLYVPGLARCLSPVDSVEYRRGEFPADALTLAASEPIQCVEGCNQPPCPPAQLAAPAQWCATAPPNPHVYACLNWLTACGVYSVQPGQCAKFDPATAKPVADILAEFPDAYILIAPPSVRSEDCCSCDSQCFGGDYTVGPYCPGGASTTVHCCGSLLPCGALGGNLQAHSVVTITERTAMGETTVQRETYDGSASVDEVCAYAGTGTRHRTVDIDFGPTPGRVVDVTTTDSGPGGPVIGPPALSGFRPPDLVAPWLCAAGAVLRETVGCLNYQWTFRYAVTNPDGSSLIVAASVTITQQPFGGDGTRCHDECAKRSGLSPASPGASSGGCSGCGSGGNDPPPEVIAVLGNE